MIKYRFIIICFLFVALIFSQSRKTSPSVKYNAAHKLEKSEKYTLAMAYYKQLVLDYPTDIRYRSAIVRVLAIIESTEVAKAYLLETLKNPPHPPKDWLQLELATLLVNERNKDEAKQIWTDISQNSTDQKLLKSLVRQIFSAEEYNLARNTIENLRKRLNKSDFYSIDLATYLKTRMNWADATIEYLLYFSENLKQLNFVSGQISKFPIDEEITNLVVNIIENFIKTHSEVRGPIYQLLADFYYQRKNFEAAVATTLLLKNANTHLEKLGHELLIDDNVASAITVFSQLLKQTKNKEKAQAYRYQLAKCSFQESLIRSPFIHSPIRTTNIFPLAASITRFEPKKAETALQQFQELTESPNIDIRNQALVKTAWLQIYFLNKPEQALETLSTLKRIKYSQRTEVDFLRLNAALGSHDKKTTEQILHNYRATNSKQQHYGEFRKLLISVLLQNEQFEEAIDSLKSTRSVIGFDDPLFNDFLQTEQFLKTNYLDTDESGQQAFALYLHSENLIKQGGFSAALSYFEAILRDFPSAPIIEVVMFRIGLLASEIGNIEKANKMLNQIKKVFPNSVYLDEAIYRLGEIAATTDSLQSRKYFEQILFEFPYSTLTESARIKLREIE